MKTIVKVLIFLCSINAIYSSNTNENAIKGEWRGSYVINAHVTTINFYINSNETEQTVVLDTPSRNNYDSKYKLMVTNNKVYISGTTNNGVLIEYKGTIKNNTITGSFHYNNKYMKDKPGIFQLMRSSAPIIKGDSLPQYNLSLIDGKTISNNSFKGKYVMLDFWATWCPPCVAKRPKLEKLYKKYGSQIEIVSVSLDRDVDIVNTFREEKYPMQWLHSVKPDKMKDPFVKSLVPVGLPYGYIINPQGKVVAFANDLNANTLEKTFKRLFE